MLIFHGGSDIAPELKSPEALARRAIERVTIYWPTTTVVC